MLDKGKIIKVHVNALNGAPILVAGDEQFSFPTLYIDDILVDNIMMVKGERFPLIDAESNVYVIAHMKNGDRIQYVGRVKLSLDNQLNVQIREDRGVLMEERRRYYKVQSDLKCIISAYSRGGEFEDATEPIISYIKNLNLGGVFLEKTTVSFSRGDILLINFKVENEFVAVMAKVLRLQFDSTGELQGYGCQFVNADHRIEGLLAKFVYNVQLNERLEKMEREESLAEAMKRVKGRG